MGYIGIMEKNMKTTVTVDGFCWHFFAWDEHVKVWDMFVAARTP